jgi:hypothetical protein
MKVTPSRSWARVLAIVGLILTLGARSAAGATVVYPRGETADTTAQQLPPPGTHRLVRIGPEAVVAVDDQGRVTMAETPEEPKLGRGLGAVTKLVGVLGIVYLLDFQTVMGRDFREQTGPR